MFLAQRVKILTDTSHQNVSYLDTYPATTAIVGNKLNLTFCWYLTSLYVFQNDLLQDDVTKVDNKVNSLNRRHLTRVLQSEVWLSSLDECSSQSRVTRRGYTIITFALISQHTWGSKCLKLIYWLIYQKIWQLVYRLTNLDA